jgi:TldD protein
MKMPVTGNARRESYAALPMPRMTNTYMLNGDKDPQEIIASVKNGLYAVNFGGGQVDITNGKFVFSARGVHDRERQDHLPGRARR